MEDNYAISLIDAVIVGILLLSALFATVRGFTREILGILSWLLAFFAALYAHEFVFPFWNDIFRQELFSHIAAYASIFLIILISFMLLTHRLIKMMDDGPLNTLDRTLGFLFGALRGFVIISLAYLIIASFTESKKDMPNWITAGRFMPYVERGAKILVSILPGDLETDARSTASLDEDSTSNQDTEAPTPQANDELDTLIEEIE